LQWNDDGQAKIKTTTDSFELKQLGESFNKAKSVASVEVFKNWGHLPFGWLPFPDKLHLPSGQTTVYLRFVNLGDALLRLFDTVKIQMARCEPIHSKCPSDDLQARLACWMRVQLELIVAERVGAIADGAAESVLSAPADQFGDLLASLNQKTTGSSHTDLPAIHNRALRAAHPAVFLQVVAATRNSNHPLAALPPCAITSVPVPLTTVASPSVVAALVPDIPSVVIPTQSSDLNPPVVQAYTAPPVNNVDVAAATVDHLVNESASTIATMSAISTPDSLLVTPVRARTHLDPGLSPLTPLCATTPTSANDKSFPPAPIASSAGPMRRGKIGGKSQALASRTPTPKRVRRAKQPDGSGEPRRRSQRLKFDEAHQDD